jgi:hypothetical protein
VEEGFEARRPPRGPPGAGYQPRRRTSDHREGTPLPACNRVTSTVAVVASVPGAVPGTRFGAFEAGNTL